MHIDLGMALIEGGGTPLISRLDLSAGSDERRVRRLDDLVREPDLFSHVGVGGFGRFDVYCAVEAINHTTWWAELSKRGRVFAFCIVDSVGSYRWAIWDNGVCVRWCTDFSAGFSGQECLDNDGTQLPVGPRHALEGEHDEADTRTKILAMFERMTGSAFGPEWLALPLLEVARAHVAWKLLPPPDPAKWFPGPTELDVSDERTLVGIADCVGLRELVVGPHIWDLEPLRTCHTLQVLDVSDSYVTDLSPLYDLPELHTLAQHGTLISEAELDALRERRPDLRIFPRRAAPHTITWAGPARAPRPANAPKLAPPIIGPSVGPSIDPAAPGPTGATHVPPPVEIPASDVQVLLVRPRDDPGPNEIVWVRRTGVDGDLVVATLLNQPHGVRGLEVGQSIHFVPARARPQGVLIPAQALAERDRWQVTPCAACGFDHVCEAPSALLRRAFSNLPAGAEMEAFTARCPLCSGTQLLTRRAAPKKPWWRLW